MDIWIFFVILFLVLGIISIFLLRPITTDKKVQDASGSKAKAVTTAVRNPSPCPDPKAGCNLPMMFLEENIQHPYARAPILNVDDYEYNLVFKNEGDREITKQTRDKLMSQYPMDWTVQPPSSDIFQQGMIKYKDTFTNPPPPPNVNVFYDIDGSSMVPPDSSAAEQKEREALQTYAPKDPKSLTTYDAADAKEIIERIYKAKGLKASYAETGPNQITVFSTRPIDQEVEYEKEEEKVKATATTAANPENGEDTIIVPTYMNADPMNTGLDPFFTPSSKTRDERFDYTSWEPGLERMFAPNRPMRNWY